jgi:hypothetical protein
VRYLLDRGADPGLFGKWGKAEGTPMQFAKSKKHVKLVAIMPEYMGKRKDSDNGKDCVKGASIMC